MKITERDAENLCIAIMQWRTAEGKLTTWGHDIMSQIVAGITGKGSVTLEVQNATQKGFQQENSIVEHQRAQQGAAPCEDGEKVRCEEDSKDRRSDSLDQRSQIDRSKERKIIYIAGPMTGLPEHNFPAFHRAARDFRSAGYTVLNPAEVNTVGDGRSKREIVQRDLGALLLCNTIYMLRGWEKSDGACTERSVAIWAQMNVWYEHTGNT
jgi:hypothetical protein